MELEFIEISSVNHASREADEGTINNTEYKCPCGEDRIVNTEDNIPSFRDWFISIEYDVCSTKYSTIHKYVGIVLIEM